MMDLAKRTMYKVFLYGEKNHTHAKENTGKNGKTGGSVVENRAPSKSSNTNSAKTAELHQLPATLCLKQPCMALIPQEDDQEVQDYTNWSITRTAAPIFSKGHRA